jgi:3D (Asp-Asp-Asp) domain-containing protein
MYRPLLFVIAVAASGLLSSCASNLGGTSSSQRITSVKTTAYTHEEDDHVTYGAANAVGGKLKYGYMRSAATDWSVIPVGTKFQIEGEPYVYEVDDYGSALVGTNTIDLYKPNKEAMESWGARKVNIRVLRWGSFKRSLAIMRERQENSHVKRMTERIRRSS